MSTQVAAVPGSVTPFVPLLQKSGAWEITIPDSASNRLTFYTEDKP